MDSNGEMVFHVIPGSYDVSMTDWNNYYVVYAIDLEFTNPNNSVNFDMSTQPSAEIVTNHPYDSAAMVSIGLSEGNLSGFGWDDLPSGTHFVLSANLRYRAIQEIVRDDSGIHWDYAFYPGRSTLVFAPNEVYNFDVGGTLSISGRTEAANVGEWITVTTTPVDNFGSFLSYIYTYTAEFGDWWRVDPQVQLTDPNGSVTRINSIWYYLPIASPMGIYTMHFEWNTGPFQELLTTDSQFEVLPFNGLAVYIETADGQPAVDAYVFAYTSDNSYGGSGYTGSDGYAVLDLPPGKYNITAYSTYDHLFLYQASVPSPGVTTLTAVGTPEITLTANKKDGSPLNQAEVYVGVSNQWWADGYLGYVDSSGQMVFHVTPNMYDVEVLDYVNYYALYQVDQDFTNPSNGVVFDMSTQPSAELAVGHPNDSLSSLYLCPDANLYCFWKYYSPESARVVVSPGLGYHPYQYIQRNDADGNHWNYEFDLDYDNSTYFTPGEVLTFTVGGELSVTGRTEDVYVGNYIPLAETVDSFGSFLTYIYTSTPDYSDYVDVYPNIQLTDPNGSGTFLDWWWYYFDVFAPTGMYDMHFDWNTGAPYQGLLTADSQFKVLPQQTSTVIPPEGGALYSKWDDTLYKFAMGTFTDTVIVTHTVRYTNIPDYAPMLGIGHFYDVTAVYSSTGLPAKPTQPYTITIGYDDWQRGVVIEDSMGLYNWDGSQWALETTGTVDPIHNQLIATPDHFSTWGILGETNRVFLAILNRK